MGIEIQRGEDDGLLQKISQLKILIQNANVLIPFCFCQTKSPCLSTERFEYVFVHSKRKPFLYE